MMRDAWCDTQERPARSVCGNALVTFRRKTRDRILGRGIEFFQKKSLSVKTWPGFICDALSKSWFHWWLMQHLVIFNWLVIIYFHKRTELQVLTCKAVYHVQSNMNGVELDHSFKDGLKENGQVGVNITIRNNNTETSLKATLALSLWRTTVSRHEDMLNTKCDKI